MSKLSASLLTQRQYGLISLISQKIITKNAKKGKV